MTDFQTQICTLTSKVNSINIQYDYISKTWPMPSTSELICIKTLCVLDIADISSLTLADRWQKFVQFFHTSMMWMFNILLTSKWEGWAEGQLEKIPHQKYVKKEEEEAFPPIPLCGWILRAQRLETKITKQQGSLYTLESLHIWQIDKKKKLFTMSRPRSACAETASFCF